MKTRIYIFAALTLALIFGAAQRSSAQTLKLMEWNILSFEGNTFDNGFNIDPFVDVIRSQNPDIVCFNEFETATSRMETVEKLTEVGSALGMFPFFGFSYNKADGYYGNGILTKYPIVNYGSSQLGMHGGDDQRSVEWVDILVPTAASPNGVKIRIVCMHLDHASNNTNRTNQAKEAIEIAFLDLGHPALIAGDLNASYSTTVVSAFTDSTYGNCDRVCNNDYTYGSGSKLDYFFSYPAGSWTRVSYKALRNSDYSGTYSLSDLSDHYPIVGEVTLN